MHGRHVEARDQKGDWLVTADGSKWTYFPDNFSDWSKVKPHSAFFIDDTKIFERDVETGERRLVFDKLQLPADICCPSDDGKKLLYISGRGSATAATSIAYLIDVEGKEPVKSIDLGMVTHQVWLLRRPDYSFIFDSELRNDTFKQGEFICEPAEDGATRQIDAKSFAHLGVSPDGKYVSFFRAHDLIYLDVDTGKKTAALSTARWYHTSWDTDPNSLTTRMENGIYTVWPFEKKSELICSILSHNKYGAFLTEGHPEASPDATKIGFDSSMLGDGDFYVAIAKPPEAPLDVKRDGKTVPHHRSGVRARRNQQLFTPAGRAELPHADDQPVGGLG